MKVAVTGSSGFVGRHLISYLDSLSIDYVCIDRKKPNGSMHSTNVDSRQYFLDYSDESSLASALFGCNVIIHLAGRVIKKNQIVAALENNFSLQM